MSFYYESLPIEKIYYGDDPINMVYYGSDLLFIRDVTLEIVPYPSDATVTLTATGYTQVDNSITVKYGTSVSYIVSKSGHETKSGTIIVTSDQQVLITLLNQVVLTIEPTPSNATVVLTADGFTQVGNSIVVNPGTSVSYSISRTGYITQTDTIIVNTTQTLQISLTHEPCTLTINPTPSDATVTFDTGIVSGNSCLVPYGSSVTYTVSRQYYNSQTANINMTSDQTISISLTTPYYIPAVNEVICNLTGSSKKEDNTLYIPGRYEVLVQAGDPMYYYNNSNQLAYGYASGKISKTIQVNQPFIIRAYCGSKANRGAGTNPYSGAFKVNPYNGTPPAVSHIFGNGGGAGCAAGSNNALGGGNCLGDGVVNQYNYAYGAGSCLHLMPTNGVFGTDYLFAFHTTAATIGILSNAGSGSAYGGAGGGSGWSFGGGTSGYAGGSTPYGSGGAAGRDSAGQNGTGIGHGYGYTGPEIYNGSGTIMGGMSKGAAAWFNGTSWVQNDDWTSTYSDGRIYIKYLGQ